MTLGDRRTTKELLTLHELEPELRDIYVEGPADSCLIKWFLDQVGKYRTNVYDISTVEIPAEIVQSYGLENNDRDRVIALALELEASFGQESVQVTCIADSDFDLLLNNRRDCHLLLFTDYTCIEMYLFNEKCIEKFFSLCLRIFPSPANYVLNQFSNILQEIFLIRLANKLLELSLTRLTFERCCKLNKGQIFFDCDDYLTRYLNMNNALSRKEEFIRLVDSCRLKLSSDPRCQIHGHDFIKLLVWYLAKHRVDSKLANSKFVERSLFGCIDIKQLTNEKLFQTLLARV